MGEPASSVGDDMLPLENLLKNLIEDFSTAMMIAKAGTKKLLRP